MRTCTLTFIDLVSFYVKTYFQGQNFYEILNYWISYAYDDVDLLLQKISAIKEFEANWIWIKFFMIRVFSPKETLGDSFYLCLTNDLPLCS